ncbi:MAG TPA: cytochrome C oxidase subunit IV family protein [Gemmatimonadaceae bacterium]|nr:cytochrome C oxidase subunit IV family protein [Gemmatimonadaceae bacterium]
MAHDPTHARQGDARHVDTGDAADGHAHVSGEIHEHPTWSTYWKIAVILTVITGVEVSAYYIPAWEESRVYVPSMLIMSGVKFLLVVLFYMHLKYDHRLFRALFTGPLLVAMVTILALMFLFGHLAVRLGG